MGRKKNDPPDRAFMMARVARTERISPTCVRLTLDGVDGLEARGVDHWCRLFFARQGQDVLALPSSTTEIGWYLQYLATPKTRRPWVRAYTMRKVRPDVGEVDIDFVIHAGPDGSIGPAARFARGSGVPAGARAAVDVRSRHGWRGSHPDGSRDASRRTPAVPDPARRAPGPDLTTGGPDG